MSPYGRGNAERPAGALSFSSLAPSLAPGSEGQRLRRAPLRYGAKIEATRRSTSPRDRAAAIRALYDEQRAALRALVERRQVARIVARARRAFERAGDKVLPLVGPT